MAVLFFNTSVAQTFPTSCTSKDLTLLSATLPAPANDRCNCDGDRVLVLGIRNGTNSFRTSFALWGTFIRRDATGAIIDSLPIFACANGILGKQDNFLPASTIEINGVPVGTNNSGQPVIHINCGESLQITNLHLAWTSASPGETCAVLKANPGTINPKCGTVDAIRVDIGVNGTLTRTNSTCTTTGSIKVEPFGGLAPYQVCLYKKNGANDSTLIGTCQNVAANASKTFSDLSDGDYTVRITDNMNETDVTKRCSTNKMTTIANPDNVTAPDANVTDPACRQTQGSVSVISPQAGSTYTLEKPLGTIIYTAVSGVFSNVNPDTYVLKATKGVCSATKSGVTVNEPPETPTTPSPGNNGPICATTTLNLSSNITADSYSWTGPGGYTSTDQNPSRTNATISMGGTYQLTITVNGCQSDPGSTVATINAQPLQPTIIISQQPSLCASETGSVTVCSPNANYTYTISTDNGQNFGDPKSGASAVVFSGLAAGSNPIIKVSNGSTGCTAVRNCSDAVSTCPNPPNASRMNTNTYQTEEQQIAVSEPTKISAFPNPFSNKVKFVVTSSVSGKGNLEVFNMLGQKVKTVYQGQMIKGTQIFELNLPGQKFSNLIYVLRIGDQRISGKLLQLNR